MSKVGTFSLFVFAGLLNLFSSSAFAEPLKILLTKEDQSKLTSDLSKIDLEFRKEEIIQQTPYVIIKKTYSYLDNSKPFNITCSEQFVQFSTYGQDQQCEISFDPELSMPNALEVHDGFMPEFVIAEIKDSKLAEALYKSVGNGTSPNVFFNATEQLMFTHPTTGKKFSAFRLRIDCKRDGQWKNFSCVASAVK